MFPTRLRPTSFIGWCQKTNYQSICVNVRHFPSRQRCLLACCHLDIRILFSMTPASRSVNGSYYRDMLMKNLLPAIRCVSGEFFTFQQDSAPAHRARETVALSVNRDSWLHQSTGVTTEQSGSESGGLRDLGDFAGASLPSKDPRRRSSERTIDWRVASLWWEHLSTEQWISGVIDCVNVSARKEYTLNIWLFWCKQL